MRGKLRDKRALAKRESFKRDVQGRRRPVKRENRTLVWLNEQMKSGKDDDQLDLDEFLGEDALLEEDELLEKR